MKNLGKCAVMVFLSIAMLILVTQQYSLVNWTYMTEGLDNEYYVMTNATIDDEGNTIIKTMDTNGFFDLGVSKRSSFVKPGPTP